MGGFVRGLPLLGLIGVAVAACGGGSPGEDAGAGDAGTADAATCTSSEDCDDTNPCTEDTCNGGLCEHQDTLEGQTCNDGLECTSDETCQSGACTGVATDCSSLNDACNTGVCVEGTGCVAEPLEDDTECEDGLFCTVGDRCSGGSCVGDARDCSEVEDDCNASACDEGLGCVPVPVDDGTACDDSAFCTEVDECFAGQCVGGAPPDCADTDACTQDICDLISDACVHPPVAPIPDAEGPTGNVTCGDSDDNDCDGLVDTDDPDCIDCDDDLDCDDGNDCTDDDCVGILCVNEPLTGTDCEDGAFCTVGDTCAAGLCQAGAPNPCADVDACTADGCDEASNQCTHPVRTIDPDSVVATSSDDGTPLSVCLTAGTGARVLVWTELRDNLGDPFSGATVTIGGVAATEAATAPGTYYRVVTAAGAPGSEGVAVVATACGGGPVALDSVTLTHAAANATAGGTGGCSPTGGNLRVRVVDEAGNGIDGASVLVGMAEGTPFERGAEAGFGGASTPGSNVGTTSGGGYVEFRDYGAALDGPITVTAGATARAYMTLIDVSAADLVLPLTPLHPTPPATTLYDQGTAVVTNLSCTFVSGGIVLPELELDFLSGFAIDRMFEQDTCWNPNNQYIAPVALPRNVWIAPQDLGSLCLLPPGDVAEGRWSVTLPNSAAAGPQSVAMSHVRIPLDTVNTVLTGGGSFPDLLTETQYRQLGFLLDVDVPTPPTSGRSITANQTYPSAQDVDITWTWAPTDADVVGLVAGDYSGGNGTGPLFIMGHAVHESTDNGSTVSVVNSPLSATGAPSGVRRLASVSAMYVDPLDHPTVPTNRLPGVSTVLIRAAAGGGAPFGAAGGALTVDNLLDIAGTTYTAPAGFAWDNVRRGTTVPAYSRHELSVRTQTYLPVLSCATENDIRTSTSVQWVVLRPYGLACASGTRECFDLPTLPASFPRATTAANKRSGFEAVAGSGAACNGGGCASGETCVDPDGAGAATQMCMVTAGANYELNDYHWRLRVFTMGLAPGWSFDGFTFATHEDGVTHESSNQTTLP